MHESNDRPLLTTRAAELLVSAFFIILASITLWDSFKLGAGWGDFGPESGYFPFYTSLFVILASIGIFLIGLRDKKAAAETFVSVQQFKLVLKVLVPSIIYVALVPLIGIYVSMILFIGFFMMWIGKYNIIKAGAVSIGVTAVLYPTFEIWFRVPLPKGPLEAMLGLN